MSKVILERYPDKEYKFSMNEEIFEYMVDEYKNLISVGAEASYLYIYYHLPKELQDKVAVQEDENTQGRRIYLGVDIENIVYDNRN